MTATRTSTAALRPPAAASALADILLAAAQRSLALHATLVEDLADRGRRARRGLPDDEHGPLVPPPWSRTPPVEPVLRWAAGQLVVGQVAAASLATLVLAQARGAREDVDRLSRDAHEDAARAGETLTGAIGPATASGLGAVVRMAGFVRGVVRPGRGEGTTAYRVDPAATAAAEDAVEVTGSADAIRARTAADPAMARAGAAVDPADQSSAIGSAEVDDAAVGRTGTRDAPRPRRAVARKAPAARQRQSAAPATGGRRATGTDRAASTGRAASAERPAAARGVSPPSRRTSSPPRATSSSRKR